MCAQPEVGETFRYPALGPGWAGLRVGARAFVGKEVNPQTGIAQDAPASLLHGAPQAIPAGGAITFRFNADGWVVTQITESRIFS